MAELSDIYGKFQPFLWWLKSWTPDNTEQEFAILHGKPGTGKTTIVLAAAKTLGMEVHMTNASDARNKDDMKRIWHVAMTRSMSGKPRVILLDEADHISDKGKGNTAQDMVLDIVMHSRHPVVLTCNDVFSLNRDIRKSKSFRMQFDFPTRDDKLILAKKVIRAEKLKIDHHELGFIIERSHTYRALLHNLQSFSMGICDIHEDITEENLFDEFISIMEGHPPQKSNFTPDELLKWMVEYAPWWLDRIFASDHILGRIHGERSTKEVHQHAWRYSGKLLRSVRGKVDRPKRMVNGMRLVLPFESTKIYMKIKKENEGKPMKGERKAEKSKVKKGSPFKYVDPKTVDKSIGNAFSKWA
jgi:hypothetical protein